MNEEHVSEIKGIILLALALILLASLASYSPQDLSWYTSHPNYPVKNLIGVTGSYISGTLFFVFGYSAYSLVIFLFFWSWNKFFNQDIHLSPAKFISFCVLLGVVSSLFSIFGSQDTFFRFQKSGLIGLIASDFLLTYLDFTGTIIVLTTFGCLSFILISESLITPLVMRFIEYSRRVMKLVNARSQGQKVKWMQFLPFGYIFSPSGKNRMIAHKTRDIDVEEYEEDYDDEEYEDEDEEYEDDEDEEDDDEEYDEDEDEEYEDEEDDEEDDEEYDEDDEEYDEDDEEYDEDDEEYEDEEEEEEEEISLPAKKPKITIAQEEDHVELERPAAVGEYNFPSMDLLADPPKISNNKIENSLMSGAKQLEATLASFGVQGRVADIERGPAITRYEVEPASGVKVQKFTNLADDIALAMKAPAVRIVAPIPGKNRVGIEVPNADSAAVYIKDVLTSTEFQKLKSKSKLALALGKDISGKSIIADLATMPHLLIAGTTGSGKSVCVNGIIVSILMNATPQEVKLVMVDPKMVELAIYNDVPHLLAPTVTDVRKAAGVLHWVVSEMENRYKKLSKAGVKNIASYHDKGYDMPYIVVIIDELADLMQVSAKSVEGAIARLAQLSRAVGIHLILATQRPSVDVITGVIKANFPARISFKVASKVDSRTVLDSNGAESLLGRGDMLFIQPGDAKPTRGQGNFVRDEEIQELVEFIKEQQDPNYDESILKQQKTGATGGLEEKDELYDEAVRLVVETNQASVSILQRRMRLGYTRAARLIDMMEQDGIVGPYCGSKAREILVDREEWLLENMGEEDEEEEYES